mmetsp:Transcript_11131/g.32164  ORF Transcript_11131/g.32164 Transcript_11131/m.32164 type:complete len:360 (+) Transcript_11131:688-1767(+)
MGRRLGDEWRGRQRRASSPPVPPLVSAGRGLHVVGPARRLCDRPAPAGLRTADRRHGAGRDPARRLAHPPQRGGGKGPLRLRGRHGDHARRPRPLGGAGDLHAPAGCAAAAARVPLRPSAAGAAARGARVSRHQHGEPHARGRAVPACLVGRRDAQVAEREPRLQPEPRRVLPLAQPEPRVAAARLADPPHLPRRPAVEPVRGHGRRRRAGGTDAPAARAAPEDADPGPAVLLHLAPRLRSKHARRLLLLRAGLARQVLCHTDAPAGGAVRRGAGRGGGGAREARGRGDVRRPERLHARRLPVGPRGGGGLPARRGKGARPEGPRRAVAVQLVECGGSRGSRRQAAGVGQVSAASARRV